MPVYEYECAKCGTVSSFQEKMFHREPLFFGRKRCPKCGSRKLKRVMSAFAAQPKMSYADQLNELKSMGNVQFVPQSRQPAPTGPPPGGCPYCKESEEKEDKSPRDDSPIVVRSS